MMSTTTSTAPTTTGIGHGTYPTYPIVIRVLEARNLKASTQRDYSVDPYCIVSFKKSILKLMSADKQGRFQSRILENSPTPVWNEEFILHPTKPETDVIVVKVYDRDRSGKKDTLLGKINLNISQFWNKGLVDQWFPLGTTLSKTGHGEIHLLINYNENSGQTGMMGQTMGQGMPTMTGMPTTGMTGMQQSSGMPGMQQSSGMTGMTGMPIGSSTSTTTTGGMPGSNISTGSAFQKEPLATSTGYVSTGSSYPPPVGSHGTSTDQTKMM